MRSFVDTNKRATDWNKDFTHGWKPSRGAYSARGYGRGGRPAPVHRNRSLVLNGNNPTSATLTENIPPTSGNTESSNGSAPAWVAKTGRHLQLINSSIYEKDTQTRAKAIEETRKQKLKQRDDREKAKLHKHIQRLGGGNMGVTGPSTHPAANYEIDVQGIRFRVTKNGSKLAKASGERFNDASLGVRRWSSPCAGDLDAAKSTPKMALVGGVKFYRTKNGNMYRSGIIKAHRYGRPFHNPGTTATTHWDNTNSFDTRKTGVVKKINEPCKAFSTTGSSFHSNASFELFHGRGGHLGLQLTQ